jgi:hypothetical protein
MVQLQQFNAEGFASADNWFAATATHAYANAVSAIYQGLTDHVINRANLLVSLKDGSHYGSPFFDWLVTMRSTHGNLRRTSMTGFFAQRPHADCRLTCARTIEEFCRGEGPLNREQGNEMGGRSSRRAALSYSPDR